jgi:hypothetical protein
MEKRTRSRLWVVFTVIGVCLCAFSGKAWADDYLGNDWWLKVSTENVSWLNGSFTVAGYDRWGQPFNHTGNKIEIGRGSTLGAFYVTGATRLTLKDRNFGSSFYPVPMSNTATPILHDGKIEISADGKNQLTITIQNSPSLGQVNTQIVFDGVSKASVSNALATTITSSLQNSGCSEIMTAYMVDGIPHSVQHSSQTVKETFNCREIFGAMGGGYLNAPSVLIRMSQGSRSGYFRKDPSVDPADDNVYLALDQPVSNYTVEAWHYCAKLTADLSIDLPCVDFGGGFYTIKFDFANQTGSSLLWRLGDILPSTDNCNCATVSSDLQVAISCINVADGANYSAVLSYYPINASGYYWQLSSATANACNTQ